MLRFLKVISAGLAMGLSLGGIAQAQGSSIQDYFNAEKSCFKREYSKDHLDAHPDQKVDFILINHTPAPQEKAWLGDITPEKPVRVLRLLVHVKDQPQNWEEFAGCELEGNAVQCSMECDAGQFSISMREDGKLLLKPVSELWFTDCDAGDQVMNPEPDDKVFLLSSAPTSECLPPRYQ